VESSVSDSCHAGDWEMATPASAMEAMMKLAELFRYGAAKYEALFLRRLRLETGNDCDIPEVERVPRRRFAIAGSIFPTEAAWPRYQY
jgi:hypothetical protein